MRFDLRNALQTDGDIERAIGLVREAEALAEELHDRGRLAWVSAYTSYYCCATGRYREAIDRGRAVIGHGEDTGDRALTVRGHFDEAYPCLPLGDYRQATTILSTMIGLAEDATPQRFGMAGFPVAMGNSLLAWAHAELGEFEVGLARGRAGLRFAEATGHVFSIIMACYGLGYLYDVKGEPGEGLPLLERALQLCRDHDIGLLLPLVALPLGYGYALAGRADESIDHLRQAVVSLEANGLRHFHALFVGRLAEALVLAGRLDEARPLADKALSLARQLGERGHEAYALRLVGEVALHFSDPAAGSAEGHFHEAMAAATETGMSPLVGHCHLGLGKFYRHAGNLERARGHLARAAMMYQAMSMPFWSERVSLETSRLK